MSRMQPNRQFVEGSIEGVELRALDQHADERGWLTELFRSDEAAEGMRPVMCYLSLTHPGHTRGPHEHARQTDRFCMAGPSTFLLVLWDNREGSPTYGCTMRLRAGEEAPMAVIVPPGVVHGYCNVGPVDGWVVNLPNRLYRGAGKREPVDEIRHEDDPASPFVMGEG